MDAQAFYGQRKGSPSTCMHRPWAFGILRVIPYYSKEKALRV